ncbi:type I-E CRISPR-associated protein Cse2/CasB [Iodidimonas gelatinilytica]|nr:type I-E CRISPR-associated protein Cse2/CasB [Iodidimonas gelatinilytica]
MMPPLDTAKNTASGNTKDVKDIIAKIGDTMCRLPPGDMAQLRRMSGSPLRAPHFWRWKAQFNWADSQDDIWATIITAMAILTDKGRAFDKASPHDPQRPLGRVLCDGGNRNWPAAGETPRPKFSELHLTRLLNERGPSRQTAVLRAMRILAPTSASLNCVELAQFLLNDKKDWPAQKIAQTYYARLDGAEHTSKTKTSKENQ